MFFPKQETRDEWEIKEDLHKFFFLRWQEIFDETTFDSWQVRPCNLTSLLDELLIAIDVVVWQSRDVCLGKKNFLNIIL